VAEDTRRNAERRRHVSVGLPALLRLPPRSCALAQQQLAWRTGVAQSTISRLGTSRLRSTKIGTLARIVGVPGMTE
jgi:predicted transcriptional regulator